MAAEIIVQGADRLMMPCAEENISWTTERKGVPGKLDFSALRDEALQIEEGNLVKLNADGKTVFSGYVFSMRRSQEDLFSVTAYDQMRYLKNKDMYVFEKSTASDVIRMIAGDYGLKLGAIADTKYVIPSRVEENTALIDMIQTALEITLTNSQKMYVFYDLAGELTLTPIEDMRVGLIIDAETAQSYDYTSSIDSDVYNRIKLVYEDEDSGKRKVFIAEDAENSKKWGRLQKYESISDTQNARNKADAMLALYNVKNRSLNINGVLGDLRVRAGSLVIVQMNLGDISLNNFMLVERCTHNFKSGEHTMNLQLKGGDIIA